MGGFPSGQRGQTVNLKNFLEKGLTNALIFGIVYESLRGKQQLMWEHSSAGRASALQAEGHRFEPCCSHHNGPVVQLVRTLACHARGRRFEPVPGRHFSPL